MPADIHPRLLRGFVATAEELHFGRAAQRLIVAQQALSRDVRTLEQALGQLLFERSTRAVALTPAGERLLPKARQLLALHDELLADGTARPLLVDLNNAATGPDLTADRLLATARQSLPEAELLARFHGGLAAAAKALLAHRLDVAFGWFPGLPAPVRKQLTHRQIRLEPMALILPLGHPLAEREAVRVEELRAYRLDVCAGNEATTEWTELGSRLARTFGLAVAPPRSPAVGPEEFARYLHRHGDPALSTLGIADLPGTVTRPLVDPVPLSPVSLVHRPHLRHPGLDALLAAADRLGSDEGWLAAPAGSWTP